MENFSHQESQQENKIESGFASFWRSHIKRAFFLLTMVSAVSPHIEAQEVISEKPEIQKFEGGKKNAFEKFNAVVKKDHTEEKLKVLKEVFGTSIDGFLMIRRINSDLKIFHKLKELQDSPNTEDLQSFVDSAYNGRWLHKAEELKPVAIEGVDEISDLTEQGVQAFLAQTYPKGFVEKNISKIEFTNKIDAVEGTDTINLGQGQIYSMESVYRNSSEKRMPLVINQTPEGLKKDEFFGVLKHEIGHGADWNNCPTLTSAERISMLFEVYNRSIADNRYISEYVEGINKDTVSTHHEGEIEESKVIHTVHYIKTLEYWAEIFKAYFSDTETFEKEHPEDYVLVKKWVDVMARQ